MGYRDHRKVGRGEMGRADRSMTGRKSFADGDGGPVREEGSLLSLTLIQVILLILVAVAVKTGQQMIAMALLAAVLLAILGRVWAKLTARRLSIRLRASKTRMFPGDEIVLSYQVRNDKALPVLWVDVMQPLAAPVCMAPLGEDSAQQMQKMTAEEKSMFRVAEGLEGWVFRERCSLVGGYQTAAFDTRWRAVRRGIYSLEHTRIYTGDGFGLTRYRLELSGGSQRHFVIYPRIVPVNVEPFIRNLWEGESGRRGVMEDPSVIKLTRPYENGDSFKRMNWRLLARGQGMTVNQYEVVSPRALHFILDGESFRGREDWASGNEKDAAIEEALRILASLALRLSERGMDVGFTFPATDRLPAVNLFAGAGGMTAGACSADPQETTAGARTRTQTRTREETGCGSGSGPAGSAGSSYGGDAMGDILYRMAEYQFRQPVWERNPDTGAEEKVHLPSVFPEEELVTGSQQVGTYYYVTYDGSSASASGLLSRMVKAGRPVEVLTYEALRKLKEGGGHNG